METKFEVSNSRNNFFAIMVPGFYLKYAIFGVKMSSQVKSDPANLTGSTKRSWSQKMGSLAQKTKKLQANMFQSLFVRIPFKENMAAQVFWTVFHSSPRPSQIGPTTYFDRAAIPPPIFSMITLIYRLYFFSNA